MTEIVLGPPGTGKTTTLLGEVEAELARGVPPDRIGFVTFTRKGAEEAVTRACRRFSLQRDQLPWFRTLHSLCFRRLGMSRGDVFEGKRLQEFSDYAQIRITGRWSEDGTLSGFETGDRIMFMENLARVRMKTLREVFDQDDDGLTWNIVDRIARALVLFKSNRGLLDFTDMLSVFSASGDVLGLEVLFVDEAQDLSALQWKVVELLATGCRRVVVAGDDDQCIYRWAGADVDHLIGMPGDVRVLGQSWRVPLAVQRRAAEVIGGVEHRRPKDWKARAGGRGSVTRAITVDDVDMVEPWDDEGKVQPVMVLARNSFVLDDQIVPELIHRGVLYSKNGNPSIRRAVLDAVSDWEKLRRGGTVSAAEARAVYAFMSAGSGVKFGSKKLPKFPVDDQPVSMADLERDGGLLRRDPWFDALDKLGRDEVPYLMSVLANGEDIRRPPRIQLSTIHGAKGGEARHVVLMKEMARRTHLEVDKNEDDERRVWYVGATRALEKLSIVDSPTRLECPWL